MSSLLMAAEAAEAGAHAELPFPLLPAITLLPLFGAAAIALLPKRRPELSRMVAILTSIGVLALSLYMLVQFEPDDPGFQFVSSTTWIQSLDIKFALGVDGISLFLIALTAILFTLALFAVKPDHDDKAYYAWLTLLEAGCLGVFLALDLFLFFIMFELTIVPLYLLIGRWGHGRRVYAANKFFVYTLFGSVLMLISIVYLAVNARAGDGGTVSFDLVRVAEAATHLDTKVLAVCFFGFAIAFAIKTPIFPFHTWLPDAHTEAPTAGSVDLAAVVLKLGTYGFLRYGLYLFPQASVDFAWVFLVLGVIGIVYAGFVAAMQKNLKRLVAYSSVAHMGFAIIGIFSLTTIGIEGSVLVMINHGIATGALFILLGYLYKRRHTYEIAELGGLQKAAPWLAGLFTVVMLASIGVPGLNGFVGEFLTLLGVFISNRWFAVVAATGVIVAALYLLWAYQRVFHGEPDETNAKTPDLGWAERAILAPLIVLIVFLGVYPKPVLDRIEPSVKVLVEHVERVTGHTEPTPEETSPLAGGEVGGEHAEDGSASSEGGHG